MDSPQRTCIHIFAMDVDLFDRKRTMNLFLCISLHWKSSSRRISDTLWSNRCTMTFVKIFFEYPNAKTHWRMEDPNLFAVMSVKRAMLPQTLRHHQAKNIYRNIYQDTTKHFNGGIFSMIFQWQGSVFKLVWRELLVYFMIYAAISFIYRCVLVSLDDQRWGLNPHRWYI